MLPVIGASVGMTARSDRDRHHGSARMIQSEARGGSSGRVTMRGSVQLHQTQLGADAGGQGHHKGDGAVVAHRDDVASGQGQKGLAADQTRCDEGRDGRGGIDRAVHCNTDLGPDAGGDADGVIHFVDTADGTVTVVMPGKWATEPMGPLLLKGTSAPPTTVESAMVASW